MGRSGEVDEVARAALFLASDEAGYITGADPGFASDLLAAGSRDFVRSKSMTGKPARQLRTRWTEAWEQPGAPDPLPMPLQGLLYALATQHNFRIHVVATVSVIGLGFVWGISANDWRWLVVAIAIVLAAELVNTAFEHLCDVVQPELHASVKAAKDVAAAVDVWNRDEEVDEHYNAIFRELLTYMMGDPRTITAGAHLLFVAKNLERIGDRKSVV